MTLAVAIQMDPIESVDIDGDSTFALALEAQARGHGLYFYLPKDLSLLHGRVVARAHSLEVQRVKGDHARLGDRHLGLGSSYSRYGNGDLFGRSARACQGQFGLSGVTSRFGGIHLKPGQLLWYATYLLVD